MTIVTLVCAVDMITASFDFIEHDDHTANVYGMTFDEIKEFIDNHNMFFETHYGNISEFNDGEDVREIIVNINLT